MTTSFPISAVLIVAAFILTLCVAGYFIAPRRLFSGSVPPLNERSGQGKPLRTARNPSPLGQEMNRHASIHKMEYPPEILEKLAAPPETTPPGNDQAAFESHQQIPAVSASTAQNITQPARQQTPRTTPSSSAAPTVKKTTAPRTRQPTSPARPKIILPDYKAENRMQSHDIGDAGESIVKRRLAGYLNYHNLTLANILHDDDKDGPTSQIDHLLIGRNGGLTIIETKNWSGTIHGSRSGPISVTSRSGQVYSGKFNPIKQAERQQKFLRRALDAMPESLTKDINIYVKVASVGDAVWDGQFGDWIVSREELFDYIKKFGQRRSEKHTERAARAKKILDRLVKADKRGGLNEIHLHRMRKPENQIDLPETI